MKKIINNKLYDTETAKRVGEWGNGLGRSDFRYCEENLYLKKTGAFLLHGKGGAMSKYCEISADGNERSWGEKIVPLTVDEAKEWAEEKLDADECQEIFGEISEEDDTKGNFNLYIAKSAIKKVKDLAARKGVSASKVIEKMIESIEV